MMICAVRKGGVIFMFTRIVIIKRSGASDEVKFSDKSSETNLGYVFVRTIKYDDGQENSCPCLFF